MMHSILGGASFKPAELSIPHDGAGMSLDGLKMGCVHPAYMPHGPNVPLGPMYIPDPYIPPMVEHIDYSKFPLPGAKETNPKDMVGTRKAGISCVPQEVLAELGVAMLEGAAKYGRYNYRAVGVRASVYVDALYRHVFQQWWEQGEDIDADSGISHITKAIACLVVLRDSMMRGNFTDDRPPSCSPVLPKLNEKVGEILDKHADKSPRHYTIGDRLE